MTKHKHYEVILAYANGSRIQVLDGSKKWIDLLTPCFLEELEYRVEPEEKPYPETNMSGKEINEIQGKYFNMFGRERAAVHVVNLAFRRACEAGLIVSREEFDRAISDRDQRDIAVAKEVVKSLCWVLDAKITEHFNEEYLLPVIARVKQ